MKEIYLAGGCFWGTEKYLSLVSGVLSTETGYANGATPKKWQRRSYSSLGSPRMRIL